MNYSLLSLSQLEHAAKVEDNILALAIIDHLEDEVEKAKDELSESLKGNDADYSYKIYDAVLATEFLLDGATWYRSDNPDIVEYLVEGLHEDTSPHNNHLKIYRNKGSDRWTVVVNAGQYGEDVEEQKFVAEGFKKAQQAAARIVVKWISQGLELNV